MELCAILNVMFKLIGIFSVMWFLWTYVERIFKGTYIQKTILTENFDICIMVRLSMSSYRGWTSKNGPVFCPPCRLHFYLQIWQRSSWVLFPVWEITSKRVQCTSIILCTNHSAYSAVEHGGRCCKGHGGHATHPEKNWLGATMHLAPSIIGLYCIGYIR